MCKNYKNSSKNYKTEKKHCFAVLANVNNPTGDMRLTLKMEIDHNHRVIAAYCCLEPVTFPVIRSFLSTS